MGGMDSGVTADTKTIVFESAYFNPSIIRKASRSHGVSSDSSYRFERGVCINTMELAIKYALHLLKQYMPMAVFSREIDEKEDDIQPKVLTLRKQRVELISGIKYTDDDIVSILSRLRFKIEKIQDDKFRVTVPTFRNDIERKLILSRR
jgi:phenylalanyl-tRNA synthetase beta chain